MQHTNIWLFVSALALAAGAGCGDDEKTPGGQSAVKSDGLSSKDFDELDDDEVDTLCDEFNSGYEKIASSVTKLNCTDEAVANTDSVDDCEEERDACIDDTKDEDLFDCDAGLELDCDGVAVKVLRGCFAAVSAAAAKNAPKLECDPETDEGTVLPSACEDLEEACFLSLFGETED